LQIAEKVRVLRKSRGWTQAEVAGRLGLSQARLREIENGDGTFTADQFLDILKLFNIGIDHFTGDVTRDTSADLQNALVRLGGRHLQEHEAGFPTNALEDLATVLYETLVSGTPRLITALAPVLVLHVDEINLNAVRAKLASIGLQRRLDWLVDNTCHALREELQHAPPRAWARRYRRAELVLETALAFAKEHAIPSQNSTPDILDGNIRSKATLRDVLGSSSEISRRWGIATALQPHDFTAALRGCTCRSLRRHSRNGRGGRPDRSASDEDRQARLGDSQPTRHLR
jgi:transcriptional regulator with XRE-family HTH domain